MEKQQMIEFIHGKCLEANSDIQLQGCSCKLMSDENGCLVGGRHYRDIRLADVLLAIEDRKTQVYSIDSKGIFSGSWGKFKEEYSWNLFQDNLNDQDEPTIKFIYDILK